MLAIFCIACTETMLQVRHTSPALLSASRPPEPPKFFPPKCGRPLLAIVIDDLGASLAQAVAFTSVPLHLSFSVLPDAPEAPEVARFLVATGYDVLVHIPMEPQEEKGTPAQLAVTMSDHEILERLEIFMARVPGAVGANNHMGSMFMKDHKVLAVVLKYLHSRGMFFLDSRTTPATVGKEVALRVGIPFVERDVFLDHDTNNIEAHLREALEIASRKGYAIAIGHPRTETQEALLRFSEHLKAKVSVVPISYLVRHVVIRPCVSPALQ